MEAIYFRLDKPASHRGLGHTQLFADMLEGDELFDGQLDLDRDIAVAHLDFPQGHMPSTPMIAATVWMPGFLTSPFLIL